MSASSSRLVKVCTLVCGLSVVGGPGLFATELTLQKVPPLTVEQAPAYPQNLARNQFGAQVEAVSQEGSEASPSALISSDPTTGYSLSSGSRTLVITSSKIENIDKIAFLNHGVKGSVRIATSNTKLPADSADWHVVSEQDLTGNSFHAKVGPSEAKYVKLTFSVIEPGRIAGLGVYPAATTASLTSSRSRKLNVAHPGSFALINYNLTEVHTQSRALYVSSGDEIREANNMIDDQSGTSYTFASDDAQPTAIIDLGKVTNLRRITALYTPRPGTVNFYVMESLPGHQANAPKTLKLDDASLANLKAVGSVSDGSGRAAIDFPETPGRYILVKWAGAGQSDAPFSVSEIAAFGGNSTANLIAASTAASSAQNRIESDGKSMGDAKDFSKDMPEEGPETPSEGPPPALPPPPPFTFVPELQPTSP